LKATASFLKNATITPAPPTLKNATATTGSGTEDFSDKPKDGKDLFGLGLEEEEDDGGGGGFWMPEMSLAREPTPRQENAQKRNDVAGNASDAREIFDGYNVWRKFHSQTKNRPFWHCKETGATRWEMPAVGAVQNVDKVMTQPCSLSFFLRVSKFACLSSWICVCVHEMLYFCLIFECYMT
jgi:hypothetical protein